MGLTVSVIIPHYNDLDRLDACLTTLELQSYPAELVEIIVADNNSSVGAAAVEARIAGRARMAVCWEAGAGPARNAGVAVARHDALAFTDSDCLAAPGWLAAGLAALGRTDIVGGRVTTSVREHGARSGAEAFEQVFAFDNRRYIEEERFSVTANLFMKREVFAAVGGFRAHVSEDKDWCQRAAAAGFCIAYERDAIVTHPARVDWPGLLRKWRRLEQESFALASEQPRGRLRWLIRSFALPPSILAHAPRVLRSPMLANDAERWGALKVLARLRLWRFWDAQRRWFTRRGV